MKVALARGSAMALPIASESVQTCVTSPPYWGLRQYAGEQREVWGGDANCAHEWGAERIVVYSGEGRRAASNYAGGNDPARNKTNPTANQGAFCACGAWYGALGLEPTTELYVSHMVEVFREVKRVLRKDGTLWLNLGDSYAGSVLTRPFKLNEGIDRHADLQPPKSRDIPPGLKPKDLCGIPWMVAFALRADGWYLRSDIIWAKPNPMPESVTDRPTKAHEYLFLLSKSQSYFYDADAIREDGPTYTRKAGGYYGRDGVDPRRAIDNNRFGGNGGFGDSDVTTVGRNKRTVWTIATQPYAGAHFATFPEALVEPCILAGSAPKACGVCGAPWERETEQSAKDKDKQSGPTLALAEGTVLGRRTEPHGGLNRDHYMRSTKTGWAATCAHDDDTGASLVLDPFNGSGTTGRVAARHGRDYVGIDISDEYLKEQSRARINNIQHVMGGL